MRNCVTAASICFICRQFGWEARFADADSMSDIESKIDENTKAVFLEVIANPGGVIVDLEAVVEIAHRHGLPVIVDNTSVCPQLMPRQA